ncbi:hypothetical protein PAXINDRAFT_12395 [Paxillus involutus ATCC 200175]|uniref:Uncharacterized protein n=1 Tax=Paxillus involutus ATCC 200175 TaxID=664439 RepID=A0A0C9U6N2_PAXIN|nr:hypothetical protein PAXINDRAFT_12395 [Paxillus involutus ATCC 200175]
MTRAARVYRTPNGMEKPGRLPRCTETNFSSSETSSSPEDKPDAGVLVVDWDGSDDPQNLKSWSFKRKWAATAIVSGFVSLSPYHLP